jgi:N-succinyldiaminopimelate aminotransferase
MRQPPLTSRLAGYGTTVFAEISSLAVATGAINMGQGFPDEDGPPEVLEAAVRAIRDGHNQYPPGSGVPELLEAVAAHQRRFYGLDYDPRRQILVTAGATEAIAATILALCESGDEVVTFEPYYDSYAATIALSGAERRVVPLRPPDWSFDPEGLARAITPRTRLILLNTPHNPTGRVFSEADLAIVADICVANDLIAVTDEVYEHLVFEGRHSTLAGFPGMRGRTLAISSAAKTFAVTGWKVGWICGPEELVTAVRTVKQFLTFASGTPFQLAVATGLGLGDDVYERVRDDLRIRRDRFCDGLEALGWTVHRPAGTYFATVDSRPLGFADGWEMCRLLPADRRVAAVPTEVFYDDKAAGRHLVRFAFCKRLEVIDEALVRLGTIHLQPG